jgi:hypothetical protein
MIPKGNVTTSMIFTRVLVLVVTMAAGLGAAPRDDGQTPAPAEAAAVQAQTVVAAIDAALAEPAVNAKALATLARQAGTLAQGAGEPSLSPEQRAALRQREVRAYALLADAADREGQAVEAGFRSVQMRQAAGALEKVKVAGSAAAAKFWRLQADLFDARRLRLEPDEAQAQAAALLTRFVYELADVNTGNEPNAATAGPEDDALTAALRGAALEALAALDINGQAIGSILDTRLPTPEGQTWSTLQERGRWVLLAFVEDKDADADKGTGQSQSQSQSAGDDTVDADTGATAALSDAAAWAHVLAALPRSQARWRTVAVASNPVAAFEITVTDPANETAALAAALGVRGRRAWVVLDPQARVAAVGHGFAFLTRFVKIPSSPLRSFDGRTGESP